MNIKFTYNNAIKTIEIGKINIFYGYNNSGKSSLLKLLYDGFSQKNKNIFQIDGIQSMKSDYEILSIDNNFSLDEQLKMGAKSYLKKLYLDKIVETIDDNDFSNFIFDKFTSKEANLNLILSEINNIPSNKIRINIDLQTIEELILNNLKVELSDKNISSSDTKNFIYNIAIEYLNRINIKRILFIDDFDLFFDNSRTFEFLNQLEKMENTHIFLFTSNPQSLQYSLNKYNVFTVRENKLIDFSNINKIINASIIENSNSINESIEDYIITNKIIITENEYKDLINQLKNTSIQNFGRMLTNKYYSFEKNSICLTKIIPYSSFENNFLHYIDTLLNDN